MTDYAYLTLDDPSATETVASGINDLGQIVGSYVDSTGSSNGFLYSNGKWTTVDDPLADGFNNANGINAAGQIVGVYEDSTGAYHGFLFSSGTWTTLDDPSTSGFSGYTDAQGINASGQIVGYYLDSSGASHGFLYSGGSWTTLDDPSAGTVNTVATNINASGEIVGYYKDSSNSFHGFLYSNGTWTTLDDPSAAGVTLATGINASGQIVGYYEDSSGNLNGFLYSNGTWTTLDEPSANGNTQVQGINALGQIVGLYEDSSGNSNGFFTALTPAEQLIDAVYQSVLQRPPTSFELTSQLTVESNSGIAAVVSAVVDSQEAQFNVDPIIQIIQLATGVLPTAHQLAGWVPFIEQNGLLTGQAQTNPLLDQMAEAFVASDNFAKVYNPPFTGTDVNPNSPVTANEMQIIIKAATGIAATQTQVNVWVGLGLTIDQVFVDFALGDQYTAFSQAGNQQYLTGVADAAAGIQASASIVGSTVASLVAHA